MRIVTLVKEGLDALACSGPLIRITMVGLPSLAMGYLFFFFIIFLVFIFFSFLILINYVYFVLRFLSDLDNFFIVQSII